ncbi:MAG: histidine phosphatase family protein [Acidimicrobiales bacterium]|nr:histidine phosphatase family protein [Acidimicrobiales bacterium]
MKTLHLLRHAKSDWSDPSLADHDRPLNARGRRSRRLLAEHVVGWPVDLVRSSTARRARATAKPLAAALGLTVETDPALYGATGEELLEIVRRLPEPAVAVVLVGHNPGIEELSWLLTGASGAYPTAALGTIELDCERWAVVGRGAGRLVAHVTPAELVGGR